MSQLQTAEFEEKIQKNSDFFIYFNNNSNFTSYLKKNQDKLKENPLKVLGNIYVMTEKWFS